MTEQERAADRPVTLRDLAEVFGCMWNAAMSTAHRQQGGMDFACILAEGFGAMTVRLEELAAAAIPDNHAIVVTDEMVEAGCAAVISTMADQMGIEISWPGVYRDYEQDRIRRQVRAALEAALKVKEPADV